MTHPLSRSASLARVKVLVLDPQANCSVPVPVMASSAMNGFAHCAEGLYSRLRNHVSEGLALQGIRLFSRWLPEMVRAPDLVDARAGVLTAAHLSGMVISNARVGIHHAVCHCLGARGNLSHGVANSIMLPHALAYNLEDATPALALMAQAMGCEARGSERHMALAGMSEYFGSTEPPTPNFAPLPLASRIHEGLVFSNRDTSTLLDKIGGVADAHRWLY